MQLGLFWIMMALLVVALVRVGVRDHGIGRGTATALLATMMARSLAAPSTPRRTTQSSPPRPLQVRVLTSSKRSHLHRKRREAGVRQCDRAVLPPVLVLSPVQSAAEPPETAPPEPMPDVAVPAAEPAELAIMKELTPKQEGVILKLLAMGASTNDLFQLVGGNRARRLEQFRQLTAAPMAPEAPGAAAVAAYDVAYIPPPA